MDGDRQAAHMLNMRNRSRYAITAWFYDFLDFPWEMQYRKWRPGLLHDVQGHVLEAGVGTGRNLEFYPSGVNLTGLDFSPAMLRKASKRAANAACSVRLVQDDATRMESVSSGSCDWVIAFFLCCVLPPDLQAQAVAQFGRVLKPGGRFRLLEMRYSADSSLRRRQDFFAPFVARVYGAGFDRNTLTHVQNSNQFTVTGTRFLKHDTYLLIEGVRR